MTFYEKNSGKFASLGHGVTEINENNVLPITSGAITKTKIYSIKKGMPSLPGEIKGSIEEDILGDIALNTGRGVYGILYDKNKITNNTKMKIALKNEIKIGKAYIYCTLENDEKKSYEVQVQKISNVLNSNKNMIIKITDEELIEKTGGIIQGMSGSPIVQDGKIIGAVTHVFLNDPLKGYAVFAENMIQDLENIK